MSDFAISMSTFDFSECSVLVTGAARNTGLAVARMFAEAGAHVYVNGRDAMSVHAAVEAINATRPVGRAEAAPADIGRAEDIERMFAAVAQAGRGLDVLVNNAVAQGIGPRFDEVEDALLEEVLRVNVMGYFRCGRAAARLMGKRTDGRHGGAIVNLGSNVAERAIRNRSAYVASKGAIDALTRAMAVDLGPLGIRVNTAAPGYIATDRWDTLDPAIAERRRKNLPLGREAAGEDIARAVLFLASPASGNITGQRLVVDGGMLAQHAPVDCDR